MGTKSVFKCTECGYQIDISLGVGVSFPRVYRETVEKAKAGTFGDTIKDFLQVFPEGRIDAEPALYLCQGCGNIEVLPALSMYLPKGKAPNGNSYVTHRALEKDYVLFEEYPHKCSNCQSMDSLILREETVLSSGIKCPQCKVALEIIEFERWD